MDRFISNQDQAQKKGSVTGIYHALKLLIRFLDHA